MVGNLIYEFINGYGSGNLKGLRVEFDYGSLVKWKFYFDGDWNEE